MTQSKKTAAVAMVQWLSVIHHHINDLLYIVENLHTANKTSKDPRKG